MATNTADNRAKTNNNKKINVAVIGAGVAGLQALRSLVARKDEIGGGDIVCFEVEDGCGGQWHHNYSSLKLQVPKQMYEFPDMPNTKVSWGKLPTCKQVSEQCEDYVEKFGLSPYIKFSTEVVSIEEGSNNNPNKKKKTWKVKHRKVTSYERAGSKDFEPVAVSTKPNDSDDDDDDSVVEQEFDFVVIATGPYSHRAPFIPKVPGMDDFQGEILHSSTNLNFMSEQGKRVVVIGACKSAHDQAIQAVDNQATSVTQIMRRAHWGCPQNVLGLIPFEYFFASRFGEGLVHTYNGSSAPPVPWGPIRRFLNFFMWPIAWLMLKTFEYLFIYQESLYGPMRPTAPIVKDFHTHGYTYPPDHALYRRKGKIVPKIGEIVSYTPTGVNVRHGAGGASEEGGGGGGGGDTADKGTTHYECDMVIYGTGYKKQYTLFAPQVRKKLGDTSNGLCLYRQIVHPELPQLAFVGSEFNTITNVTTSALQGEWTARWIAGDKGSGFHPTKTEMDRQIQDKLAFLKKVLLAPTPNCNNPDLQQINYGDILLKDMGESCYRKFPNLLSEYLMPYGSADYNGLVGMPLKHNKQE